MAEGEAERGGDDHGLDMRFGDPGASGNIRTEVSIDAGMLRDLAPVMMGAPGNRGFPKGLGPPPARGHEHGEAAVGEAERADVGCIQPSCLGHSSSM